MPNATAQPAVNSVQTLQGQIVPANAIDPTQFFMRTRRKRYFEANRAYAGLGGVDLVELRKSDIIAALHVRFTGTLTVVHSTGSINSTMRWPYDLVKAFKFTANGQSNLHNYSGLKAKFRESAADPMAEDRGVSQQINGVSVVQGTLSMASESWGVGSGATAIPSGNYSVELYWKIAVAEDEKDLSGSIFAQTSSMDLTLEVDWNTAAALFTITAPDTVALAGNLVVESEKYSIPSVNGQLIIPDLSLFHSVIQTSVQSQLAQGDNELRLIGQGAGRTLLRVFYQTWNGATPVPLAATAANYGPQGWRYGTNETPEYFLDGRSMRQWNEQLFGCDTGAVWGFLAHDFATTWAFRDTVDQGATSDLRLYINFAAALTNPTCEYVQETMYSAGSAA